MCLCEQLDWSKAKFPASFVLKGLTSETSFLACTKTEPSGTAWTSVGYDDSQWYVLKVPVTDADLNNINFKAFVDGVNYCRVHRECVGSYLLSRSI